MKKTLTSILILSLFLFTEGCSPAPVERVEPVVPQVSKEAHTESSEIKTQQPELPKNPESPSPVKPISPENPTAFVEKKIVEIGDDGASCIIGQIQDMKGNPIDVPQEITDDLQCLVSNAFSHNWNLFTFTQWDEKTEKKYFKIYNFTTKKTEKILELLPNNDVFDCMWREDNTIMGCLAVNQSSYKKSSTKFFIMHISEAGTLIDKKIYPLTYETMADYGCGAECYGGKFWFEGEHTLKYEGHNAIEETAGKVFSLKY